MTIYEHGWFNGKSQTFNVGRHNVSALNVVGNDTVSSIKVQYGCKVKLFEHANFQGRMATFGPGIYTVGALINGGFGNDILSSLIVENA